MPAVVPLVEANDEGELGGKAVQLGMALRAGLPVPNGVALPAALVELVASGEPDAIAILDPLPEQLASALAVRSSGLGEDSRQASFAGQHLTVLNVCSPAALADAVGEVHRSASSAAALAYRRRLGLGAVARTGVIVQRQLEPDVAGVLFTANPITGADERVIEASWGLGEAVVAGRVIPDRYRVGRDGKVLERTAGSKDIVIRPVSQGGTVDRPLGEPEASRLCLGDRELDELHLLATRCEEAFGPARDIEWAFADSSFYLLQCRPATA
jgi:pyruvate, water dikinase